MTATMVCVDNDKRHEYQWEAGRTLARDMLAYVRDRLDEQGRSLSDISAIGVFRGPGSFTGLRIGLTVLNTLARTQHIPIVGATGESWEAECLARIECGEDDQVVLPEYGGDAHVTSPRK